MRLLKLTLLWLTGFLLVSSAVFGQAARSPFSSFGLGEPFSNALTQHMGMGGVGVSNPSYWYVNNMNPAMLPYNRLTTFQASMIGEQRYQSSDTLSERSGSGNLNYLVLAIPIMPGKWTSSISLQPYTRLNYQTTYRQDINGDPNNTYTTTEKGSGGVNQFTWSNGLTLNSWLSVGLKATYLFSAIVRENSNILTKTNQALLYSPNITERTFVTDFQFSPAIHIHKDSISRKNYRINFGLVYDFGTNLKSSFNQHIERRNLTGIVDSLTTIKNYDGHVTIPSSMSAGISLSKGYDWTVAIDGYYANYSTFRDMAGINPYASNAWKVNAGFEITPDQISMSNYLKRLTYRTGVSIENSAYLVNGNPVKDFGITFGVSLPVSRISSLDLALKVGHKGDKTLNTIEENYLKLYFGLTFNDQWFIKRRFD
ncbi:MAG: hypothetical protein JST46_02140 [Bacteroidetes bacterium]|nr:hypothetical protein [Bacteroidota bacterium]